MPEEYSGFRWVVLSMAFFVNMLTWGASYSVGVLYSDWMRYFDAPASYVGFVGGLLTAVSCLAGPVFGYLIGKFGCRSCGIVGGFIMASGLAISSFAETVTVLLVTFGIVTGFGTGLVNFSTSSGINYYFKDDRAFAEGVLGSGVCVGIFVFSGLLQMFGHYYTWKGAVLLLGAICFHNSICGLFLIPQQEIHVHPLNCCRSNQKRNTVEEVKDCSRTSMKTTFKQESFLKRSWRLWKCPVFLLILLVDFLAWIATFVPYVHLVERARQEGFSAKMASWLSASIGASGLVGRPLSGAICSFFKWNPFWTYSSIQIFLGLSTILSPFWSDIYGLFAYATIVGLLSNSYGLIKASTVLLLDVGRFVDAYSWMMLIEGIGISIGPLLAGVIYDATQSYDWSFHFSGILLILSGSLCFLKNLAEKMENRLLKSRDFEENMANNVAI